MKSWEFPGGEDHPERHGQRDVDRSVLGNLGVGRSIAIRDAARNAAALTGSAAGYVTRLLALDEADSTSPALYSPPRPGKGRAGVDTTAHSGRLADILAYAVAVGLAAIAAWFSLKGLAVLFPDAPHEIVVMGAIMECAKLVACGWLAGSWRHIPWVFRGVLMLLITGLAVINASGTFSQLTAAHVGSRTVSAASRAMEGTNLDARIEVAAAKPADLDRRIASIDAIVAGAAQRGRTHTAACIMEDQRKARAALVAERERAAQALADSRWSAAASRHGR